MKKKNNISNSNKWIILLVLAGFALYLIIGNLISSFLNLGGDDLDPTVFGDHQPVDESIEVSFPVGWIMFQTPGGNHGDLETIAVASRIDYSFAFVNVARRVSLSSDLNLVADWGEERVKEEGRQSYQFDEVVSYNSSYINGFTREYSFYTRNLITPYTTTCKDLYFSRNGNDYIFSLCDDEKEWDIYLPVFNNIINSIRPIDK